MINEQGVSHRVLPSIVGPFELPTTEHVFQVRQSRKKVTHDASLVTISVLQAGQKSARTSRSRSAQQTLTTDAPRGEAAFLRWTKTGQEELVLTPQGLIFFENNGGRISPSDQRKLKVEKTKKMKTQDYVKSNANVSKQESLLGVKQDELVRLQELRRKEVADVSEMLRQLESEADAHRAKVLRIREEEEQARLRQELANSDQAGATTELRRCQARSKAVIHELDNLKVTQNRRDTYRDFLQEVQVKGKKKALVRQHTRSIPLAPLSSGLEQATTGLPPPGEILRGISDVLTLSMQEVQERQTAGQNRVEATHKYDQAKEDLDKSIESYQERLEAVDKEIRRLRDRIEQTKEQSNILRMSEQHAHHMGGDQEVSLSHLHALSATLEGTQPSPGEKDPMVILTHIEVAMQHITDEIETLPRDVLLETIKSREKEKREIDKAERKLEIQSVRKKKLEARIKLALEAPPSPRKRKILPRYEPKRKAHQQARAKSSKPSSFICSPTAAEDESFYFASHF